ncbi:hypothetical protein ES703_58583 [subsurface metagenome]
MVWQGDPDIPRYLGLRGFKCLLYIMMEELNALRVTQGLPEYTWAEMIAKMNNHMSAFAEDDEGPEPNQQ